MVVVVVMAMKLVAVTSSWGGELQVVVTVVTVVAVT